MAFKIFKLERKNDNWVVASLVDATGEIQENVSINKVSKKGDVFPGFDELVKDQKIEGRLWKSDSDKVYLFALKGGAKAPMKHLPNNSIVEQEEYPVSEKLETILNKLVGQQIKLEQILELLQPKKIVSSDDTPDYPNDIDPDLIPF